MLSLECGFISPSLGFAHKTSWFSQCQVVAVCVCELGLVPVTLLVPVSQISHCSVCRRDIACFQPRPLDAEDSNSSFYRSVESPAWDCFDL